ncbi:hypothetical protein [Croceicoccus naphthovorans]|uniref:Uncharacterized protein n=1 Tax=Croceicoccus naphthovorans TaxID=1348774 RepID=A0A0G3XCB5_9SPHN|nr:hypothetical protein [Croceicoccus naphthovorans]AKM09190.1 hypothetical protein AB433_03125 [Croceicoccus naphthovorans]MBB3990435.1 MFS family permease [Croceicoccus naphthovorans]
MYSDEDLNSAVASGAITLDAAQALRDHVAQLRSVPHGDEESFRLLTSFNDIFVTVAAILLIIAVGTLSGLATPPLSPLIVAATALVLTEYFALKRRMALPSVVLTIIAIGAIIVLPVLVIKEVLGLFDMEGIGLIIGGVCATIASWLHWRRYRVPIAVAAGAAGAAIAASALVLVLIGVAVEDAADRFIRPVVLLGGLTVFAWAMWWDMTDRTRTTRRSDVAFWLHLLAAPMIAHPLFSWFGVFSYGALAPAGAMAIVAIYVLFGLIALAIDRRALLVSALAYVLAAIGELVDTFGKVEAGFAITMLIIGSALLLLSAAWSRIRSHVVAILPPSVRDRLPPTETVASVRQA